MSLADEFQHDAFAHSLALNHPALYLQLAEDLNADQLYLAGEITQAEWWLARERMKKAEAQHARQTGN